MSGNRTLYGEDRTYPKGLTDIPLASYFKITRYQYNDGLKNARESGQNDASTGLANIAPLTNKVRQGNAFLYGGTDGGSTEGDQRMEALNNELKALALADVPRATGKDRGKAKRRQREVLAKISKGEYEHLFRDGPITLTDGTVLENANQLADIKNESYETADTVPTIYRLPMPNEFQYSYGASWGNTFKLGTMARVLDDPTGAIGQMLATGTLAGVTDAIGQIGSSFTDGLNDQAGMDISKTLGKAFKGATDPLGVNSDITQPANFLGLAGLAPNENAIMMFSKMEMRSFSLSFEFFARDEEEAENIDKIINGFKTGMHPVANAKGTGGVLGFPDLFKLEPWFGAIDENGAVVDGGQPHPMMPRSKMCALTNLNVNSSPSNNFVTTKGGQIPLQTISCTFAETTALTSADLETGRF
jgi:hypothetical protein